MASEEVVMGMLNETLAASKITVDEDTVEYMAGMVFEELSLLPRGGVLSNSIVYDLIGPFLIDSGCSSESAAKQICSSFVKRFSISVKPQNTSEDKQHSKQDKTSLVPVSLKSLMGASDTGYEDPFLGLTKANVNFNSHIPIADAIKLHKAAQRERELTIRRMREWEKEKLPLPPPTRHHGDIQLQKVTDVIVDRFAVSVAGKELLKDAALRLTIGRKYGLVGRNGIGKSTFVGALVRKEIDGVPPDISVGCIEQEIIGDARTALDAVLDVDVERSCLLAEEKSLSSSPESDEVAGRRLARVYTRLQEIDANGAEGQAAAILSGLGFTFEMQGRPTKHLSGGWRMRVALARALFSNPDILCLDEPTNHLDLHAVAWLTEYLQTWSKTCIVVSHARGFLNDVCTDIMHFKDQSLKYYRGDYDTFERTRVEQERLQQRHFDSQQKKRDHIQTFIDKFRYNAKRAALVQSRIKALEKLPMLDSVSEDPTQVFNFAEPESLPAPVLRLQDVSFSYSANDTTNYLLKDICLDVDFESRLAICGVNGSGKSTLLKLLMGMLEAKEGMCTRHNRLRIGYFCQHHVDGLDLTLTAVQQLQARFPEANLKPEDARNYLGKFGITGLLGLEPLYILSGGQKSRVAIALMAFKEPHILILDEPTNHLDLEAVQALIVALNNFKGGVVIVSHDSHLLQCVIDEVWHVDPITHTCAKFPSDFDTYKKQLLQKKIGL